MVRSARSMRPFIDWILNWSKLNISNIFEIGANFGQDADYLMCAFNLSPKQVYVFEAHPELYEAIIKIHQFNAYNNAVFNEEKEMNFHVVPLNHQNTGISSLHESIYSAGKYVDTKEVKVNSIRMDNFMEIHNIKKIDFLKLDAEGVNYEVLQGFGHRITDINCIHTEAEHMEDAYGKNKTFEDIADLLICNGFHLIYFQRYTGQSDSFWIRKEFIKKHRLEK